MKKHTKKFLSLFLTTVLLCSLLSISALAAQVSNEQLTCKYQILYMDDDFPVGYNFGDSWSANYTCQFTSNHSTEANHSLSCADIKTQADVAAGKVSSEWKIVGWAKEAKANAMVWDTYSGTTRTDKLSTIYLVAKKPTPANVTYTLSYDANGGSGAPGDETAKSAAGSAAFTVSSTVPVWNDHDFLGWAETSDAAAAAYHGGDPITLTSVSKTLYAVWKIQQHTHLDGDDDGYCDDDHACMHAKDSENYCTVSGCSHPDICCPKRSSGAPAAPSEAKLGDILGADFVTVSCENDSTGHPDATYGLLPGGYAIGGVQGDNAAGYTLTVTLKKAYYAQAFGADAHKTHVSAEGETDKTVSLRYDAAAHAWMLAAGVTGAAFRTTCSDKVSEPGILKQADGQNEIGRREPGESMLFTLTSTVPSTLARWDAGSSQMVLTEPYLLVFHDTMNSKLESDYSDLKVTLGGVVLDDSYYTVAKGLSNGESLNVTLDLAALYRDGRIGESDLGKTSIVVSYTASVAADAQNGDALRNDAQVSFPGGESVVSTVEGSVVVTPHTGGAGTAAFTVLGVTLLGGAAGLAALGRKRKDSED